MATDTSTLIRVADPTVRFRRSAAPAPEAAVANGVPGTTRDNDRPGPLWPTPPAYRSRRRPASPLGLAATTLAVVVAAAVTTLGFTVPDEAEITVLEGPALVAGAVGMAAGVIGFLLAYIAAVQSQH